MKRVCFLWAISLFFAPIVIAGCGSAIPNVHSSIPNVQHVVVIMQENRSFDNLFNGFPGADTVQIATDYGKPVPLKPVGLEGRFDLDHTHPGWWKDWDGGKMDGFAHPNLTNDLPYPTYPLSYVPQNETVPLWTLAQAFTLGDRMFASNSGPSFVAHQYMIAAQSGDADENPVVRGNKIWGCDAPPAARVALIGPNGTDITPGVFPCFDYQTLGDEMDAAGISWRYYAPTVGLQGYIWSAYDAIRHIRYGPDWTANIISPNTQIFTDVENGTLAEVTWVVPNYPYSDHPGAATGDGPDWVGDVVNAIGQSKFWDSTVIFIAWDDWGGWYDHVVPPQIDNMGLGFRVPLIVVSPWAKHGYISHQVHEFGSFLHYTEEVFSLPSLGKRDAIADDFSDCFDYSQQPQPYVPVPTKHAPSYFERLRRSDKPPDDD